MKKNNNNKKKNVSNKRLKKQQKLPRFIKEPSKCSKDWKNEFGTQKKYS